MPRLDVRENFAGEPPREDTRGVRGDGPGETLTIVNDHEPKPLYYEMAAEVPTDDEEAYEVRQDAPDEFRRGSSRKSEE